MNISVEEQLEAYTTWKTRELLAKYSITTDQYGLSTSDGRDVRKLWTFTYEQLVQHLQAHPERADSYLTNSQKMKGVYDRDILEHERGRYVLYWQDHGKRRNERFYGDLFHAAADWLTVQYGMWLHEHDA